MKPDEGQLERMRKAVKAFRKMQPSLTSYAKALTGNPKVRVVLSSQSAMTDGTNIYFRPPLSLGDEVIHDKRNCDKRDPETYIQLCRACAVREEVYVNIFHEIGHIAFQSFEDVSEHAKEVALMEAASEMGDKYADALAARFKRDGQTGYLALSHYINPYFNGLFNAIEDARVDGKMFKARPGIRVMMQASNLLIFREGTDPYSKDAETNKTWSDAPLNAQAAIACICRIDGYRGWEPYLNPDVVRHTGMPNVQAVLDKLALADTVEDTFRLALPLMEELREYGYFKKPDEIPDPPPPPSPSPQASNDDSSDDEGDDDSSNGTSEGESSDSEGSSGEQQGEGSGSDVPDSPDSSSSDEDSSEDANDSSSGDDAGGGDSASSDMDNERGESSASSDAEANDEGSSEVGDDAGDSSEPASGSDPGTDSPDQDGSGGGDQQEETEGSEGDGDSDSSGDDASSSGEADGSDMADDSGQSSSGGMGSGEGGENPGSEGESPDTDDTGGGSSTGDSGDAEPGEQAGDDDTDSGDGSDSAGEADRESDGDDSEEGGSGEGADSADEGGAGESGLPEDGDSDEGGADSGGDDSGGDVPDDSRVPEEVPHGSDDPSDSGELEESTPPPPDHKHGVDGQPCQCGHCLTYGSADDLNNLVHQMHEQMAQLAQEEKEVDPFGGQATEQDFAIFIDQSEHMDTPSKHIEKVMIHASQADPNSRHFFRPRPDEEVLPESVVGGALLHARKTFADNMRASQERNLRRGRVHAAALGRRAWQNDPRLFQKNRQPGRKDYSVLLGLDLSTSSLGEAHRMIRKAALAQAEICSRLGLRFAVYGHSGNKYTESLGYSNRRSYDAMDIIVIKDFNSPWDDEAKTRMMSVQPHGANLDGHTLEYYRKRLDEESTTDRILMYYTDGHMPWANKEEELEVLDREIKMCERKGYTLMGVEVGGNAQCPPELDTCQLVDESDVKSVVKHLAKRLEQR